jgi:hypothetical protein
LNLIQGHAYTYRVKAENFLGYGVYSSSYTFTPRSVPGKPANPPTNVALSTTRSVIYIQYDEVTEIGGSPLLNYNIYIDDGLAGSFSGPYANGLLLAYNTIALTLTTGRTYQLKYSAVNSEGEGPLSDVVAILLAEVPSIPSSF